MPTRRIQVSCPNCRTPQVIEALQVFDVQKEPPAKQRMLSGTPNLLQCPACGYQGPVHMPMVYHDLEKSLLLTYVPQELGLPMHDQERVIGPLLKQVVDGLAPEQRRAYLFQPRTMLTMQTLVETILQADGITKDVIEAQQQRVQLLQRLANLSSVESIQEVAAQEDSKVDREFFSILNVLVSNALSAGDEALARRLVEVQQAVLPVTTYGKEVQRQNQEVQQAAEELQNLGAGLTREKLLDLMIQSPTETRVRAYVSLARAGLDYEFFTLLGGRIDKAGPENRPALVKLRDDLLELTRQYDAQAAQQAAQMKQLVDALLAEENPQQVLAENPDLVSDLFLSVVEQEIQAARSAGDLARSARLQGLVDAIQQMAAPPPEFELVNDLVSAPDDAARIRILESAGPEQVAAVTEMLLNLLPQVEANGDAETIGAVKNAYRLALKVSMRLNLQKNG